MRKLRYEIDLKHLSSIKNEIVPVLFTMHQFDLIERKFSGKKLSKSENNEFSRAVSRKMAAINILTNKSDIVIHGQESMLKQRLKQATNIIKKQKSKVIISGSYLFFKNYNDIDIFIISKYKRQDKIKGNMHFTYLDSLDTLFAASIMKMSVQNFMYNPSFKVTLNDVLQKYELLVNMKEKKELRDFLLYSEYYFNNIILSPKQLRLLCEKYNRKDFKLLADRFINMLAVGMNMKNKKILIDRTMEYEKLKSEYKKSENITLYLKTYRQAISLGS